MKCFNGTIYTPDFICTYMINILKDKKYEHCKSVLEPSCGKGAFYKTLLDNGWEESDITGFDIDEKAVAICQKAFPRTKTAVKNFLELDKERKYDIVVGNPPYVRFQSLSSEDRKQMQNEYPSLLTGNFDLYMYFLVKGIDLLSDEGVLVYIIPKSWWLSRSGEKIKKMIFEKNILVSIDDLSKEKIFSDAATYNMIIVISKNKNKKNKTYQWREGMENSYIEKKMDLPSCRKILTSNNGIATLRDDVFFIRDKDKVSEVGRFTHFEKIINGNRVYTKVETDILKDILKVSKKKLEKVIYPYKSDMTAYTEDEMKENFPECFKYLLSRKKELLCRDNNKENKDGWYTFGRRQGLKCYDKKRLFISTLSLPPFSDCIYEKEVSLFYSGLSINGQDGNAVSLCVAKDILRKYDNAIRENSSIKSKEWYSLSAKSFEISDM